MMISKNGSLFPIDKKPRGYWPIGQTVNRGVDCLSGSGLANNEMINNVQ
jgi:hypothetical protein